VKRPDLVDGVVPHTEPLEGACKERAQGVGPPARVAGGIRPGVVVLRAADRSHAAVVGRAAADHARPRQLDPPADGVQVTRVVVPRVRGDERAAVQQVGRPATGAARAVVRPRLENDDLRLALGREAAGDHASSGASADDDDVACEPLHRASIPARGP